MLVTKLQAIWGSSALVFSVASSIFTYCGSLQCKDLQFYICNSANIQVETSLIHMFIFSMENGEAQRKLISKFNREIMSIKNQSLNVVVVLALVCYH